MKGHGALGSGSRTLHLMFEISWPLHFTFMITEKELKTVEARQD